MIKKIKKPARDEAQFAAIARIAAIASVFGALAMLAVMQAMPSGSPDVVTFSYNAGPQSDGNGPGQGYQVIRLESQFLSDEAIRGIQAELQTMQKELSNCVASDNCN